MEIQETREIGIREKRIILWVLISIIGALTIYTIVNLETMKANPLDYLEEKLGQDCRCLCYDNGIVVSEYSNDVVEKNESEVNLWLPE